jgi:hypothetical protein
LLALSRRFGRIEYVQTWEQHRSGVPHVNVVLRAPSLLEYVDSLGSKIPSKWTRERSAHPDRVVLRYRSEFRSLALRSGFGREVWIENAWTPKPGEERPLSGLASYLVKLSRTLGVEEVGERRRGETLAGELTRATSKPGDQTPIASPVGFRRIRASRGTLPPRYRGDPEWTGKLGAACDPPWTWGIARQLEEAREIRLEAACSTLRRLSSAGLPIPETVRRVLSSWEKVTSETSRARSARASSQPEESASIGSTITKSPERQPPRTSSPES